jgi:hypothetical protein
MTQALYVVIRPPNGIVENTVVDLSKQPPGWNTQLWVFGSRDERDAWFKTLDEEEAGRMIEHVVDSISFGSTGNVWLMNARDML